MGRAAQGSALLLLTLLFATPVPAAERRVPEGFFGINGQHLTTYDQAELDRAAAALRALGVERVRKDFPWSVVERGAVRPSQPDWTSIDRFVLALAREGITTSPIADFTPQWARETVCQLSVGTERCRPARAADYAAYTRKLVERYGRGGAVWAAHPEVTARPIESVEIWNEQNANGFFRPEADPEFYGQMYREARAAMREVDSDMVTVVGGFATAYPPMIEVEGFLDRMGSPDTIDAIAIHQYGNTADELVRGVVRLRTWMDGHGLANRPIFFNEWGQVSSEFQGGYAAGGIDEARRATLFREVASQLGRSVRTRPGRSAYVGDGVLGSAEPRALVRNRANRQLGHGRSLANGRRVSRHDQDAPGGPFRLAARDRASVRPSCS